MTATWKVSAAVLGALVLAGCTAAPVTDAEPAGVRSAATAPSPQARATGAPSIRMAATPRTTAPRPISTAPRPISTSAGRSTAAPARTTPVAPGGPSPSNAVRSADAASVLPVAGTTGSATQLLTVTAVSSSATRATLQAWTRTASGWVRTGGAVPAWLGYGGMTTHASENFNGTPVGSFALTQAFGNDADPGTKLPYFQASSDDWWSGDSNAPGYNTHQHCVAASCPFDTAKSENLHDASWVYGYAVVIDYNTPARPGRGSAFFLHVTENKPTQGCVSIARAALVRILGWLDPARHPRILMGVNRS